MREEAVLFGSSKTLVGIFTKPSVDRGLPAFIILNSGIAHRVGTSCLYVKLARHLAGLGFPAFRFDFAGVGDSKVRTDTLKFEESAVRETQDAMDYLSEEKDLHHFVVTGICRGSEIAFSVACRDARVVGAVFMNHPLYYGEAFHSYVRERQTMRYFWKHALFNPRQWSRAIRGRLNYRRVLSAVGLPLKTLLRGKQELPEQASSDTDNLNALVQRGAELLLIYAENDTGLDSLHIVLGNQLEQLRATGQVGLEVITESDHTFTLLQNQRDLLQAVEAWVQTREGWVFPGETVSLH